MKVKIVFIIILTGFFKLIFSQSNTLITEEKQEPKIEFEHTIFDFNSCQDGEIVKYTYKFKNTGTDTLYIKNIESSSTNLIFNLPTKIIPPSENGVILLEFNSTNASRAKSKGSIFQKRIVVTTNANPQKIYLIIKGKVHINLSKKSFENTFEYTDYLYKKMSHSSFMNYDTVNNTKLKYHEQGHLNSIEVSNQESKNGLEIKLAAGFVHSISYYKKGKLNGVKTIFNSGNPIIETEYVDGLKSGQERFYFNKGDIRHIDHYKQDIKIGSSYTFDQYGFIIDSIDYKNFITKNKNIIGKWVVEDNEEEGKLIFYKNGNISLKEGDEFILNGSINNISANSEIWTYKVNQNVDPVEIELINFNIGTGARRKIYMILEFIDDQTIKLASEFNGNKILKFNKSNTSKMVKIK